MKRFGRGGAAVDAEEASAIGARARMIRRRRGLSLDVVAGLAGINKPYLSQVEQGQRGFNRRGLLEDLAIAWAAQWLISRASHTCRRIEPPPMH